MTLSAQGLMTFGDIDTYVALLNEECPIDHKDNWVINSFVTDGDTVQVVLQMPSSLAPFLPQLTGEGDNVKRMWAKQLKTFGHPWGEFLKRMAEARRTLAIIFHPKDARKTATVIYAPEDYDTLSEIINDE